MKNKNALSEVVTTVIMIALVMAAAAIIWGVVSSLIKDQTSNAQACFGNYDKITLYGEGTCYNPSDLTVASIYIDSKVKTDKIIVTIHTASLTKSFEIPGRDENVALYSATSPIYNASLSPIAPNSGVRYLVKGLGSVPTSIEISPVIGGSQCGISDNIKTINACTN